MRAVMLGVVALAVFVLVLGSARAAENSVPAPTYVENQRVLDNFEKKGGNPLIPGDAYRVQTDRRTANGNIEIHEKETDIFYVTQGEATFVTGGKMIGGKVSRPDQLLGTDIEGGETHHLAKGDVVVIPAGTPHWFKQVPQSIQYFVVKSIQP